MTKNEKLAPIHPGKTLERQFFQPLQLTKKQLVQDLHLPLYQLENLINEKEKITPEIAYRLSCYFQIEAEVFLNLQQHYDLEIWKVRQEGYIRKQINDNNIKRQDANDPNKVKRLLSSTLFGFKTTMGIIQGDEQSKKALYEEVKQEYYKWFGGSGIDINKCPSELNHFLFEINEILEGRGDKLDRDIENRKWEIDPDSREYEEAFQKLFTDIGVPLENERKEHDALEGKTYKDVKVDNDFGDDSKPAEQAFKQMGGQHDYQGFSFISQAANSSGGILLGNIPSANIVRDVKIYPKNWRVEELATELGYDETKQEVMLIHLKNARLDDYNQEGKLNFSRNPIYRWESFNAWQRFEIKKALNISGGYFNDKEIKWVVKEVKDNPAMWGIKEIDNQVYLVHNLAKIERSEVGTLIHNQQKFNEIEWAEINRAFERAKLISEIKQNAKLERGLCVVNQENGEVSEAEDWFIHNRSERKIDDKTGYLVYDPNLMIRVKDLSEAEQKSLNYSKSEQNFRSSLPESDDNKGISESGIVVSVGIVGFFFTAVILVKKTKTK